MDGATVFTIECDIGVTFTESTYFRVSGYEDAEVRDRAMKLAVGDVLLHNLGVTVEFVQELMNALTYDGSWYFIDKYEIGAKMSLETVDVTVE